MSAASSKISLPIHIVVSLVCISAEYVHSKHVQTNITQGGDDFSAIDAILSRPPVISNFIDRAFESHIFNVTYKTENYSNNRTYARQQQIEEDISIGSENHAGTIINRQIDVGSKKNYPNITSDSTEKPNGRNESDQSEQDRLGYQEIKGIEIKSNLMAIPSEQKGNENLAAEVNDLSKLSMINSSSSANIALRNTSLSSKHSVLYNEILNKGLNKTKAENTSFLNHQENRKSENVSFETNTENNFKTLSKFPVEEYNKLNSTDNSFTVNASLSNSTLNDKSMLLYQQENVNTSYNSDALSITSINVVTPDLIKSTHLSLKPFNSSNGNAKRFLNDGQALVEVTTTEEVHLFGADLIDRDESEINTMTEDRKISTPTISALNSLSVIIEESTESTSNISYSDVEDIKLFFNVTNYLTSTPDFRNFERKTVLDYDMLNITVDFENTNESADNDTIRLVQEIHWPVKKEAIVEGDIILGGLMMVHEREEEITCGPVMPQGGIQALEAMLFTLDKVNEWNMLPNITIGAHILDDCDKDTYGLEMAVDFIKDKALGLYIDMKLTMKKYNTLKENSKERNADIYPNYNQLLEAKNLLGPFRLGGTHSLGPKNLTSSEFI